MDAIVELHGSDQIFSRVETKYLVPIRKKSRILELLQARMSPSYPDSRTNYNLIESIYFDSGQMEIYRSHFRLEGERFKLRVRCYGPNGIWNREFFLLELKKKFGLKTDKFRFAIRKEDYACLLRGESLRLSPELRLLNASLTSDQLKTRMEEMNQILKDLKLEPLCLVTYRREAFEQDELRVTVDEGIVSKMLRPIPPPAKIKIQNSLFWENARSIRECFLSEEQIVLEIKHQGTLPCWLSAFLDDQEMMETSFSKYCYGITDALMEEVEAC